MTRKLVSLVSLLAAPLFVLLAEIGVSLVPLSVGPTRFRKAVYQAVRADWRTLVS